MSEDLAELYQEVILDHSRRPRNFGELPDASVRVHGHCEDIKFTGHGCAISQASASLLTLKLKGKSRDDAHAILRAFQALVTGASGDAPPELGDLRLLRGVQKFPQRVKCAMLAARAAEQALQQTAAETTVSTEVE
jgi:nitrogen fixation NifU-like protein